MGKQFKIKDLVPDDANFNTGTEFGNSLIDKSLSKFGAGRSILIDKNNRIIAGNKTIENAASSGFENVVVVETDGKSIVAVKRTDIDLNTKRGREMALADNATAKANISWDAAALTEWEMPVEEWGVFLDEPEVEAGNADAEPQIDKAEELRAKWGVEPGQLWELGDHRLLCGDSRLKKSTEVLMGGGLADMVITDPPYGVAYVGKTKDALKVENDDVDEKTLAEMCKDWFDRADEVSRDGAYWVATVPPGPLHGVFFFDWKQRGILRQVMVWNKDSMVLGHSEYHYKHEPILFGWKPGDRLKNADRTKTTVWDFPRPKASREHPTMKPVEMWCYAIQNHTRPKDTVYEPFAGSGTTLVACQNLNRKCYAIEISENYCAVILERMQTAFPDIEIKRIEAVQAAKT